ncbi:hypothetical protein ACLB2K_075484 [Fragaria x ananassa]
MSFITSLSLSNRSVTGGLIRASIIYGDLILTSAYCPASSSSITATLRVRRAASNPDLVVLQRRLHAVAWKRRCEPSSIMHHYGLRLGVVVAALELEHEAVRADTEGEEVEAVVGGVVGARAVEGEVLLGDEADEDGVGREGGGSAEERRLGVGGFGAEELGEPLGSEAVVVGEDGQDALGVHVDGEEVGDIGEVGADDLRLIDLLDRNIEHHFWLEGQDLNVRRMLSRALCVQEKLDGFRNDT